MNDHEMKNMVNRMAGFRRKKVVRRDDDEDAQVEVRLERD